MNPEEPKPAPTVPTLLNIFAIEAMIAEAVERRFPDSYEGAPPAYQSGYLTARYWYERGFRDSLLELADNDPIPPPAHDVARVGDVLAGRETHWTALFWRLYAKSDGAHRFRLLLAFPQHVGAFERWYHNPAEVAKENPE